MKNPELNDQGLVGSSRIRPEWEVSPRQVKSALDAGEDMVLIDCRTQGEHTFARIESGILVPLQEASERLPELLEFAERRVVVFCHHGLRSLRMVQLLRQEGFEDVKSMAGGIDLWSIDIDSNVPRY